MKYAAFLPLTALFALTTITFLVNWGVLPPGEDILNLLQASKDKYFFFVIFLIIFLESIVYVGFYFPGQFFAVVLVVGANPRPLDILYLTLAMVIAATLGSLVNYGLGRFLNKDSLQAEQTSAKLKHLLVAMIHINSLAFFMFAQGSQKKHPKIIALAGLLNLPYYLLLIAGTAILSEQIMQMAENPVLLFSVIGLWLAIALFFDYKKAKRLT